MTAHTTTAQMESALLERPAANASSETALAALDRKLDALTRQMEALAVQVQWLGEQALDEQRRRREWDELRDDLMPVVHEGYRAAVAEMQTLEPYVSLDDLLLLLKRLARNTRNLNQMLDWLESGVDLTHDINRMGREMMTSATETLQTLEQKGYMGFVRQGAYVVDQVVTSFSEEDVKRLGDNVVLILNTVKALTQPEMMQMLNNLTAGFHEAETSVSDADTGLLSLLRQIRDPDVRRGLAVTLSTLKHVSQQAPRKLL